MLALVRLITSCEGFATFASHEKCWYASKIVIASDKTDDATDALMCIAWHGAVLMSSSTFSGTSNSADLIKNPLCWAQESKLLYKFANFNKIL
jgi:hypothetical protein